MNKTNQEFMENLLEEMFQGKEKLHNDLSYIEIYKMVNNVLSTLQRKKELEVPVYKFNVSKDGKIDRIDWEKAKKKHFHPDWKPKKDFITEKEMEL